MIQRVYERAAMSGATEVIVATDDQRIADEIAAIGGRAIMTSADHPSGTDRITEVCEKAGFADDQVVVNVQGDEPLIPPAVINQVANNLQANDVPMATLAEDIVHLDDLLDPNIVKVVTDAAGVALYFSRAPIPWPRDEFAGPDKQMPAGLVPRRHLGIYAYRVGLLKQFVCWPPAPLEQTEKLEQLRAMWNGARIHVANALQSVPPGIDTEKDLARTLAFLKSELK